MLFQHGLCRQLLDEVASEVADKASSIAEKLANILGPGLGSKGPSRQRGFITRCPAVQTPCSRRSACRKAAGRGCV